MKRLLLTGASGSFGSALIRKLMAPAYGIEKIVAYSRNESAQATLRDSLDDPGIVEWILGDVRDEERLYDAMHRIDTIIHAAAMKRVGGNDPGEVYSVNVSGTIRVVRAALKRNVPKILVLSTDKACAPATAYGASKLAAEFYAVYANKWGHPHTRIACTRWGNVLGSAGSVVQTWRRQAFKPEPLTITDRDATRFWVTMDQVTDFTLRTVGLMRGGEVFIPEMRSATLADLAGAVAPLTPLRTIPMRAGEKQHEVIISRDESNRAAYISHQSFGDRPEYPFVVRGYYVIEPATRDWPYQGPGKGTDCTATDLKPGDVSSENAQRLDRDDLRLMLTQMRPAR